MDLPEDPSIQKIQKIHNPMSSPLSPAKAKRTGSTKKTMQGGVTLTAQKRLEVAILVQYGWNTSQACREVGADRAYFVRAKWSEKYEDDGPSALLEDNRHHVVTQRTPAPWLGFRSWRIRATMLHQQCSLRQTSDWPPGIRDLRHVFALYKRPSPKPGGVSQGILVPS